ncbi:hypothetical protein CkaCkLH20_09091 [Colletotrichum karsti]|uniref:Uncharacterized protein n=1 Tax=Colletotrichum karsti TaxID=1095194 RepID=A0A9P6HXG2_9PEZI|nr:uncharacterized protein CkaCkLH20_09091 [Colletotrichum karsti]KAF9873278.1 hypothetical protein CkaCkLH20_09091 [Colletotrichum karsti]
MLVTTSSVEGKKSPDTEFLLTTINQTQDSGGLSIEQCKSYFDKLHVAEEKTKLAELMQKSDRCLRVNVEMQNIKAAIKSLMSDIKNDKPSHETTGAAENLVDYVKAAAKATSVDHLQAVSSKTTTVNDVKQILPPDMSLDDITSAENYIGPVFASILEDLSNAKIELTQLHHSRVEAENDWIALNDRVKAKSAQMLEAKKAEMTKLHRIIAKKKREVRDLKAQFLEDNDATTMALSGIITMKDSEINRLEAQLRDAVSSSHDEMEALRQENETTINGKNRRIFQLLDQLEEARDIDYRNGMQINHLSNALDEAYHIADRKESHILALRDRLHEAGDIDYRKGKQIQYLSVDLDEAYRTVNRKDSEILDLQDQLHEARAISHNKQTQVCRLWDQLDDAHAIAAYKDTQISNLQDQLNETRRGPEVRTYSADWS